MDSDALTTGQGPAANLAARRAAGQIHADPVQEKVVQRLQAVHEKLAALASHPAKPGFWARLGLAKAALEAKARQLAGQGYAAFALDLYGEGRTGSSPEECARLMNSFLENRSRLQARIKAGLDCLRGQPEVDPDKIAAMGFCFGGLCVLDLARSVGRVFPLTRT